ncbi:MAG: YqaE/Pmp3 family membrane protein [Saprospiraceae bacterium]
MIIVAILLPWLSFFLRGKIITGIICIVLQITVIGWIPAAIWAVLSLQNGKQDKEIKNLKRELNRR